MELNRMLNKIGVFCLLLIMAGCSTNNQLKRIDTNRDSKDFLRQLVYHMPAKDTLESILINEALLSSNRTGILQICAMLTSGNDEDRIKAQYALSGLSLYVTRPGLEVQRLHFVGAIHEALNSDIDKKQKAFLISQLQLPGDDESVPVLKQYLIDQDLCEPACLVLTTIESQISGKALQSQLDRAEGKCKTAIMKAIGDLCYLPAAEEIKEYADNADPEIRTSALYALANMGYQPAQDVMQRTLRQEDPTLKANASAIYLLWTENLEDSDKKVLIYRQIIRDEEGVYKDHVKIAALNNLVEILGEEANYDLIDFVKMQNETSRLAALNLATEIGGETETKQWIDLLRESNPEVKSEITAMLGERGDPLALAVVLEMLKSQEHLVRLSAIESAYYLAGSDITPHAMEMLKNSNDPQEHQAVKGVFLRLPINTFLSKMTAEFSDLPLTAKITCMEIMTQRQIAQSADLILEQLKNDSSEVRLAALESLKILSRPDQYVIILTFLLNSENPNEKDTCEDVLVEIASQIANKDKRVEPINAVYGDASIENKEHLLRILKRVNGTNALEFVSNEIDNSNPEIKDLAIRTLVDWPSPDAIEPIISLARSEKELTYKVLAIRGCLRILREHELGVYRELEIYDNLIGVAEREEEKKLILAGMATTKSVESLKAVSKYIPDYQLSDDAIQLALAISAPTGHGDYKLKSDEVASTLIETWMDKEMNISSETEPLLNQPAEGFIALFNGEDLTGWKGLVDNPIKRAQMSSEELEQAQAEADKKMRNHWRITEGILHFDGQGSSLCTLEDYGNFELLIDWKIEKDGDSGIYLRGSPQVQIWDPGLNSVGSGGLFNNKVEPSTPLRKADNPIGEWNKFRILMIGKRVTVYLNDILVVDNVTMENYWERDKEIYPTGSIELQAHHSPLYFRNIFIRQLPDEDPLFNGELFIGMNLNDWQIVEGEEGSWGVKEGILYTEGHGGGWISTTREFSNFRLELEFRVPPGGNSGVFIRAPQQGDPAYTGMEIQVLDDYAQKYENLKPWQYTGSIYGVVAPKQRVSKKANQWQKMEIHCDGPKVQVWLNGKEIINTNLIDHMAKAKEHPGLKRRKGFIGLQNHSSKIEYRNIRIRELD
jgi:HEAT repeat protein